MKKKKGFISSITMTLESMNLSALQIHILLAGVAKNSQLTDNVNLLTDIVKLADDFYIEEG